ncbi:hypothetical protein JTE90_003584 [Oedothorax gibbosus]|uniref:Uncharacterized protein n=1 Tax=Oedothorax gibbosus TaxID=931172 RepID=A0AAV6VLZ9_9ARAC|nr:hypothetical protein JTE90_003584 [Oedothorax gibbosus]
MPSRPINESLQKIFQSSNSVASSSKQSRMFSSNISLINSMGEQSYKANRHLPQFNASHSQNIFATQTLSLTETNSNGSFNSFKRSYVHEEYVFQQLSPNPVPGKNMSTEYFRSPHHLSGSYITEVDRQTVGNMDGVIKNINKNKAFNFCTEQFTNTPQVNDAPNTEIDTLLCMDVQHDVSKFRSALKELCSEISQSESFNHHDCDSIENNLIPNPNHQNENQTTTQVTSLDSKEIKNVNEEQFHLGNLIEDRLPLKTSSCRDIVIQELQNIVPEIFNLSPKEMPFLCNSEIEPENGSDLISFLETDPPSSECIDKIIKMLSSPKPDNLYLSEEVSSDNDSTYSDQPSIDDNLSNVLRNENESNSRLNICQTDENCNILVKSLNSETPSTLDNFLKSKISNRVVNKNKNTDTNNLTHPVSGDTGQLNLGTDLIMCSTAGKCDKNLCDKPISEMDISSPLYQQGFSTECSASADQLTEMDYNVFELPNIFEKESSIEKDHSHNEKELNNSRTRNSLDDFSCESFELCDKNMEDHHMEDADFNLKEINMDLSTDVKFLQTLDELQMIDQEKATHICKDTSDYNVNSLPSVMMSGLTNKDLMDEREMLDNYQFSTETLTDVKSNANVLFDDLDMLIGNEYPFLIDDSHLAFSKSDYSLPLKQLDINNNFYYNRKEASDIEDSIFCNLKSDVIMEDFLNFVSPDTDIGNNESNSSI